MAGAQIPIIPTRTFDFGALPVGSLSDYTLKSRIDVTQWSSASLVIKLEQGADFTGGNIYVFAFLEGFTQEDPGLFFSQGYVALQSLANIKAPPFSVMLPLRGPLGASFRVTLRGEKLNAGALIAMCSIDAYLKNN